MRLQTFEQLVRRYIPRFHIKQRNYGDVAGAYNGPDYLFRMNKGEVPIYSWRTKDQKLRKRGRMQCLNLLVKMRLLNERDSQKIMIGIV